MPRTSKLPAQPWLAVCEFPSFDDAKAFQALVQEYLGEAAVVRRKLEYRKQGAFSSWRTTKAFREAFPDRSFNYEMLQQAALVAGYAGTKSSLGAWTRKAKREGLIELVGKSEWKFKSEAKL